MSIFDLFAGRKRAQPVVQTTAKKPHGAPPRRLTSSPVTPAGNVRALRPAPAAQSKAPQMLRTLSDIPAHSGVVTLVGGLFEVPERHQSRFCVLKLQGEGNSFLLIALQDSFGDAYHMGLVKRIRDANGQVTEAVADAGLISSLNVQGRPASDRDPDQTQIEREIEKLAQSAADEGASDIHIEKRGKGACVKLRIHGQLEVVNDSWHDQHVEKISNVLHTMADEDSKPQTANKSAQMAVTLSNLRTPLKLRVQLAEAYPDDGFDIVMRLLPVAKQTKVLSLEELGYAPEHISMLEYMQSAPGGLTAICGTTGSGKSTTLQTLMQEIRISDDGKKLISVEDPPEYVLAGVTQIPVVRRKGEEHLNPFAQAMRSTMRMDPDVIMIGEIRDRESAECMVSMVQSGHKALTTLHTESALGVIPRLISMGVEREVLGARRFISGLIYQTLVPLLCKHCRVEYDASSPRLSPALHARLKHVVSSRDTVFLQKPGGCKHCKNRGITGRTVCAEMVLPDGPLLECICKGEMEKAYRLWRAQRDNRSPESMYGATALEHGILKMRQGLVSPSAVESALGLLHDFTVTPDVGAASAAQLLGLGT
jgi:general secretion pathway protein E